MEFTCGFYFLAYWKVCFFGIFMAPTDQVVWSANQNNPVRDNATLELTAEGDLVLTDVDGSMAWSTNTTGMSVVGMNLTDSGNLVLFDKNNATVWQSFDRPTDSLVLGQKLKVGRKLTPSAFASNSAGGLLSLSLTHLGLFAQIETDPPQVYFSVWINFPNTSHDSNYIEFIEGDLALFMNSTRNGSVLSGFDASAQYIKFESDGHLRSYQPDGSERGLGDDLLTPELGDCNYPMVCGKYGICNMDRQCSCPTSSDGKSYFKPVSVRDPKLGCVETVPLSCEASQFQTFLELNDTSYFTYYRDPQLTPDLANIEKESCRKACASNCSCTTAFFLNDSGSCYLLSQVFSLIYLEQTPSNSIALIKVQNTNEVPSLGNRKKSSILKVILLSCSVGSLIVLTIHYAVKNILALRRQEVDEVEEDYPEQLPGLPTRFTYDDLLAVTKGFSKKLGEGGFGSVFEGTLTDGTKVAVKRLDRARQIKKSSLVEVETIGNIHHVNLVRLIGICAEKFQRLLLVYEYMSNGSVDRWIFHKSKGSFVLDWKQRRKIIYDIVKGLNYLHEECRWKIVHMDIKPQNILLDENFNAKVADFGLSKMLDRDKNQAETTVRGTPSYMAPEWLSATITEKVDVYSFGVVVLEIVCGRKVFDSSQNEEDRYLLDVFKRKAEEGRLLDIVENTCEDQQLNRPHMVNMMRLAAWCLQGDFSKRPSMLMVIKVLDGVMQIPDDLGYEFSHHTLNIDARVGQKNVDFGPTISVLPSILSTPR
ncbi:G-type lectin S-receptor-like serine/threonine-protein kinase SD2-5 [Rhodamnia argentea]|uniref:Receptor-like serine/threonine-protein kinase n=1 Tax=Rhodamnia argentea TaxID=178133 RepID=A0A8B8PA99_9MYRT|nr:G-type lectin S-receptor-like serine/threonine-protein kinase SD2-5 [Rhodamnia argentea]